MKPTAPLQAPTLVRSTAILFIVFTAIVGCRPNDAQPATGAAPTAKQSSIPQRQAGHAGGPEARPATTQQDSGTKDLDTFVPAGSKLLDSKRGDLRGDGGSGALLVIDPIGTGQEMLGEGSPRRVVLLVADGATPLRKAAENTRIVPCARCGGMVGDPYAYSRIEAGQFTISTSGGSRERWADDFTFRYASEQGSWILDKAVRQVTDTGTDRSGCAN